MLLTKVVLLLLSLSHIWSPKDICICRSECCALWLGVSFLHGWLSLSFLSNRLDRTLLTILLKVLSDHVQHLLYEAKCLAKQLPVALAGCALNLGLEGITLLAIHSRHLAIQHLIINQWEAILHVPSRL